MRISLSYLIFVFLFCQFQLNGQSKAIELTAEKLAQSEVSLSESNGWIFHAGHDDKWSQNDINESEWAQKNPANFTNQINDEKGEIEGWFRIKIRMDQSMDTIPLDLNVRNFGQALEVFLDGVKIQSLGKMEPYERSEIGNLDRRIPLDLSIDSTHILSIHYLHKELGTLVNLFSNLETLQFGIHLIKSDAPPTYLEGHVKNVGLYYIAPSCIGIILLLLLFLMILNSGDLLLRLNFACVTFILLMATSGIYNSPSSNPSIEIYTIWDGISNIAFAGIITVLPLVFSKIFNGRLPRYYWIVIPFFLLAILEYMYLRFAPLGLGLLVISVSTCTYYVVRSWKNLKGAQWAIVIGGLIFLTMITTAFCLLLIGLSLDFLLFRQFAILTFPISIIIYIVLRYQEVQDEVIVNADKLVAISEERKQEALNQKAHLEAEVKVRTAELSESLDNLKATQSQLIQSEKMASLGELTAGIAHEIQNPLNFVNNFSEVSGELLDEVKEEIENDNKSDALEIIDDLKGNLEKIAHHGGRASGIVKGMLDHSRESSGVKEETDINALCDEYLRLSYHGLKAKDNSLNAIIETDYYKELPEVKVIPQDIGRVLMNMFNNAFYAVHKKSLSEHRVLSSLYIPKVTVSTTLLEKQIQISISDNGIGMSQETMDKVFQPFFTTKPTGQGTGLGMSISYDIVTKGHGGSIVPESTEGEGSVFVITLPNADK